MYFVAGFGAMGWVESGEYRQARPDPLVDAAAGILEHMNRDHADALRAYARVYRGRRGGGSHDGRGGSAGLQASACVRARDAGACRIAFPREVTTAAESRTVLIEMLRQAQGSPGLP